MCQYMSESCSNVQEPDNHQGTANGRHLANGHHANGSGGPTSAQMEMQTLHADSSSSTESVQTTNSGAQGHSPTSESSRDLSSEIQPTSDQQSGLGTETGALGAASNVASGQPYDRSGTGHANGHGPSALFSDGHSAQNGHAHAPSAATSDHNKIKNHLPCTATTDKDSHAASLSSKAGKQAGGRDDSPSLNEADHSSEVKLVPGTHQERCWRAFKQMLRKRALIASRDLRGGFSTLLLPLVAIALVLLVLKVNINPTAPTMVLSLSALPQVTSLP